LEEKAEAARELKAEIALALEKSKQEIAEQMKAQAEVQRQQSEENARIVRVTQSHILDIFFYLQLCFSWHLFLSRRRM
jgi:uncharacterized membrane protein